MNKTELVEKIAATAGLTKTQAEAAVNAFVATVTDGLKDGDKILIAEGCTHHRQKDDIGTYKIPKWIKERTKKDLTFEFTSGVTFTEDIAKYSLIIHCGACMMNRAAMINRIEKAKDLNVPIVNYGILIAYLKGVLDRSLEPIKAKDLF